MTVKGITFYTILFILGLPFKQARWGQASKTGDMRGSSSRFLRYLSPVTMFSNRVTAKVGQAYAISMSQYNEQ